MLEAARNVACAGGEPLALTDCLTSGNPNAPEIGGELAQAIEGMSQAAEALGVPVVSGNVSLYNETDGRPIPPTPVVGCVSSLPDVRRIPRGWREGDAVLLAEAPPGSRARPSSSRSWSAPLLSLAHDVAEGGLGVAAGAVGAWSGTGEELDAGRCPARLVVPGMCPEVVRDSRMCS